MSLNHTSTFRIRLNLSGNGQGVNPGPTAWSFCFKGPHHDVRFNSRAHPIPDRTNNQFTLQSAEDGLAGSRSILLFLLFQNRQSLSHTFPVVVHALTLNIDAV